MFGVNKEAYEQLTNKLSQAELANLQLSNQLEEASSIIEQFASKEENYKKQISSINQQLTNLKANHLAELKKIENSVNKKVNSTLASIGVKQFANETFLAAPNQTDKQIYEKFMSLSGTEQTEYYKLNKVAIARALLTVK